MWRIGICCFPRVDLHKRASVWTDIDAWGFGGWGRGGEGGGLRVCNGRLKRFVICDLFFFLLFFVFARSAVLICAYQAAHRVHRQGVLWRLGLDILEIWESRTAHDAYRSQYVAFSEKYLGDWISY